MPFRSKAQMKMMFAKHPEMAKRWMEETPDPKRLPEKVQKPKPKARLKKKKKESS